MMQCAKRVVCLRDGQSRTFYFNAIRQPDGSFEPGLRHGCNEKTGCIECIRCWRAVRYEAFKKTARH